MSSEPQAVQNPEVYDAPDTGMIEAITKAEIDQQMVTARAFPRSIEAFRREAMTMVTMNKDIAKECIYVLPRDGKTISGPSSRFAEIIAYSWGNCSAAARVVGIEGDHIVAQGIFHDIERNVRICYEVRRRITDRNGRRYSADMIATTGNAACSIALRNAVHKGIPKAYWAPALAEAQTIINGDPRTVETRRKSAIDYFAAKGVKADALYRVLGIVGKNDIGVDELATLEGILTAVKEGDTTLAQVFGLDEEPKPTVKTKGAAGVKEALKVEPKAEGAVEAPKDAQAAPAPAIPDADHEKARKRLWAVMGDVYEKRGAFFPFLDPNLSDDVGARAKRLQLCEQYHGGPVASTSDLTAAELRAIADGLSRDYLSAEAGA